MQGLAKILPLLGERVGVRGTGAHDCSGLTHWERRGRILSRSEVPPTQKIMFFVAAGAALQHHDLRQWGLPSPECFRGENRLMGFSADNSCRRYTKRRGWDDGERTMHFCRRGAGQPGPVGSVWLSRSGSVRLSPGAHCWSMSPARSSSGCCHRGEDPGLPAGAG